MAQPWRHAKPLLIHALSQAQAHHDDQLAKVSKGVIPLDTPLSPWKRQLLFQQSCLLYKLSFFITCVSLQAVMFTSCRNGTGEECAVADVHYANALAVFCQCRLALALRKDLV